MTFIHTVPPPQEPHECETPATYLPRSMYAPRVPVQGSGSIWRCDECGKHWWFRYLGLGMYRWDPVRWWNFIEQSRIKEARNSNA